MSDGENGGNQMLEVVIARRAVRIFFSDINKAQLHYLIFYYAALLASEGRLRVKAETAAPLLGLHFTNTFCL